jgi:hypothetical protein
MSIGQYHTKVLQQRVVLSIGLELMDEWFGPTLGHDLCIVIELIQIFTILIERCIIKQCNRIRSSQLAYCILLSLSLSQ